MKEPVVSVIIAAYNSERFIRALVESLRGQQLPENTWMEILVVDGGSQDNTVKVARELGCIVINNPEGNAIAAKSIGFMSAKSNYVCFLDHDEKLCNPESLITKISVMNENPDVVAILTSGYLLEKAEPASNSYGSEYGDPFSRFRYRFPNSYIRRTKTFNRRFPGRRKEKFGYTALIGSEKSPALIELVAAGSFVNSEFFKQNFNGILQDSNSIPHLYSLVANSPFHTQALIMLMASDPVEHETADSWKYIFHKIRWRVSNATRPDQGVGPSGWSGRKIFEKTKEQKIPNLIFSEFGFFLYVVLFGPLLLDTLYLILSRRKVGYMMHFILAWYVVVMAIYQRLLKIFGKATKKLRYDGSA